MAKLVFTGGKFAGRVYNFAVEVNTVGRGDQNTLVVQDSSVSTAHCEIHVFGTEVIVRDLGSINGTFVNGLRLDKQQCQLKDGQIVKFGAVEARLELEEATSSNTATDITAIHAFRRYQRGQRNEPENPAALSVRLEDGSESVPPDHTVMLSRPLQAAEPILPPASEISRPPEPPSPSKKSAIVIGILALVVGLVVVGWLIWGRN